MSAFDDAFEYVLKNEGTYSNDPADSGGPTMWGIIQSEYSRWLGRPASIADVKAITKDIAKKIYYKWYWLPLQLDLVVSSKVAIAVFDQGVNRGIGWPPKKIQGIVGTVQDGHIGPKTLAALNAMNPNYFITAFEPVVEKSYQDIVARRPSQRIFLRGWLNRARRLLSLRVN
jgi:lysozyme family protein